VVCKIKLLITLKGGGSKMELTSRTIYKNSALTSNDKVAIWAAPQISKLNIERTMATSGTGKDLGMAST
jgi:hypothetical protein